MKKMRRMAAVLMSGLVMVSGVFGSAGYAATYQTQTLAENPGSEIILFPGDSVCGLDHPAYVDYAYDMPVDAGENASWTNASAEGLANQAYRVSLVHDEAAPENDYYDIVSAGYMLTVTDGSSRSMYGDDGGHHFIPEDPSDPTALRTDKAWYPSGEAVALEALPSPDGVQVFQGFEAEGANVEIQQDESSGIFYIIMPNQEVRLKAVYVDPITEAAAGEEGGEGEADGAGEPADAGYGENPENPEYQETYPEQPLPEEQPMAVEQPLPEEQPAPVEQPLPEEQPAPVEQPVPEGDGNAQEVVQVTTVDQGSVQMPSAEEGSIFDNAGDGGFDITSTDSYSDQPQQPEQPQQAAALEGGQEEQGVIGAALAEQVPAEQAQTELVTEPVTEPVTEAKTEAPAPAEPATEKQTEAAAVPAEPATEKQTEAAAATAEPAAEKQTEAPAPAAAEPVTEKQTEAASAQAEPAQAAPEQTIPAATEAAVEEAQAKAEEPPVPVYKVTFANPADVTVTAADGTPYTAADGVSVAAGTILNVTASTADTGRRFTGWTANSQGEASVFAAPASAATQLTVGASDVTVTAGYLPVSQVQVSSGSGSNLYVQGERVEIKADKAATGWRFDHWTVVSGSAQLDDPYSSKTAFVMPGTPVTVRADYEMIEYELNVSGGQGSGAYTMDEEVSLEADWPAQGKEFDKWVITSGHPDISGTDRFYATLTMPASDVSVKSTYKDGPNPAYNAIEGLENGAEYLKGSTLTFRAAGNGMGNSNPNPGDFRYKPTGYQIGSVSGGWQDSNFTTSMAINAVGDYTLTITFTKEIYRDGAWVSDGTTDTKSVSFHVVNALSVQTGDNSPIIPLIATAVIALAVVIAILVLRRRKK